MHVMAQAYLAVSPDSRNNWKEFFSQKVIARLVKAIMIAEYVNVDSIVSNKRSFLEK